MANPAGLLMIGWPHPSLLNYPELKKDLASSFAAAVEETQEILAYGDMKNGAYSLGHPEFRKVLADFLGRQYGKTVDPQTLMATGGCSMGTDIVTRVYSKAGDYAVFEAPTFMLMHKTMENRDLNLLEVPMEADGMDLVALEKLCQEKNGKVKLVYTIPVHHNPTGITMSNEKREKLVALAREHKFFIVADETYQLLNFKPTGVLPLHYHDCPDDARVFSIGSFSKLIGPGTKVAWVQAHNAILKLLPSIGFMSSGCNPVTFAAGMITEFIRSGNADKHIKHVCERLGEKCALMVSELEKVGLEPNDPAGGYFVWVKAKGSKRAGWAGNAMALNPSDALADYMRLCFAFLDDDQIGAAIESLKEGKDGQEGMDNVKIDAAMSRAIFQKIEGAVKSKGAELVDTCGAVLQIIISDAASDGKLCIDLKNGSGAVKWGEDEADVTITMKDADFVAMFEGKLDGGQAWMSGKLKVEGNMMLGKKLGPIFESAHTFRSLAMAEENMSTINTAAEGNIELQMLLMDKIRAYQDQKESAVAGGATGSHAPKKDPAETFDGWTVNATDLTNLTAAIFRKVGCSAEEAQIVAENLVESNLKGHDSHGVCTMMGYLSSIPTEKLKLNSHADVISDRGAFVHIDGQLGFGQVIGKEAMEKGIAKCKEHGVAIVGVKNSHHLARIGKWAEMACEAGFVCVHLTNVTGHPPSVAPFLGKDARLGTNPFTIGFPGPSPGRPVILDFATSEMAAGKVREFWMAGKQLREGVLLDKSGDPTTDPKALMEGCLLPFGSLHTGYKGYGLAMMCELFGGVLTGGNIIEPSYPRDNNIVNSMTVILIDPAMFGIPLSQLREETSRVLDYVKTSPTGLDGVSVEVPGEMEMKYFHTRSANGIPFTQGSYDVMMSMADQAGIATDEAKEILGGTRAKLYEDRNTRISVA